MEFLYIYTWVGKIILNSLPKPNILYSRAFLQNGYSKHLEHKIDFYDEKHNTVDLPNSTYILVVQKIGR